MTKSRSSIVTRDILYLTIIDTFLDIVVKSNFPLLSVGWYLFRVVIDTYPEVVMKIPFYITSPGNVSVAR